MSTACPCGWSTRLGKGHLTAFALEVGAHALRFFTEYFGIHYPGDKLDMVAIPDFAGGRHGEPGMRHLPRVAPAGRPGHGGPGRARAGGRRDLPRDRPHVVRRPGDHEVVERDLAQRGLRHLHGGAGRRRLPARMAAVGELRGGARSGHGRGRTARHPASRVPGRAARGGRGDVRRPDLPEGRKPAPHAGAVHRPRRLPRGHPRLPGHPLLRQHRDPRPVGRPRAVQWTARGHHHEHLDRPGWLPADDGGRATGRCPSSRSPTPGSREAPSGRAGRCRSSTAPWPPPTTGPTPCC